MNQNQKAFAHVIARFAAPFARIYFQSTRLMWLKRLLWRHLSWRRFYFRGRTKFGFSLNLRTDDLIQGYIYYFGVWEPNLSAFIARRLRAMPARTFVDVGANIGYFTVLAAALQNEGNVIAIEAFPETHKLLEENIAMNGLTNVTAILGAATEKERTVTMFSAEMENIGATSSKRRTEGSVSREVRGLPLCDLISLKDARTICLIKIDVEGAEYEVIQGLGSLFDQMPDDAEIIVEITPELLADNSASEIFSLLTTKGFFPYQLVNDYSPQYYMEQQRSSPPLRIHSVPAVKSDIVFSKRNADVL